MTGIIIMPIFILLALAGLNYSLKFTIISAIIIAISIVTYYQWKDDNFTMVITGLTKSENNKLTKEVLDSLDWDFGSYPKLRDMTVNKYFLLFLNPKIIPKNNNIYINFQYNSTSRTGRLPFFFGISSYYKQKFINTINERLYLLR